MAQRTTRELRIRRHRRVRLNMTGTPNRPRVAVSRTNKHISVQVIDDLSGRTLAAASSVEKGIDARMKALPDGERRIPLRTSEVLMTKLYVIVARMGRCDCSHHASFARLVSPW